MSSERSDSEPEYDENVVKALVRKQDVKILPLSAFIYLLCYLDRSNIGNAKVLNESEGNDLLTETKMSNYQYIISLMVFLIAYAIFEVPSNYLLKKLKPSAELTTLARTGILPHILVSSSERSLRVALILASATLAGAFGGAIAYGVGFMNGALGLSAWRWLFIIEGAPSCASAILVWFVLPDYPETAEWLRDEERELAIERLKHEGSKGNAAAVTWAGIKSVLTDWRLCGHYAIYFGISTPFSSLSLFTPSITAGLAYQNLQAQLMTVPPYAAAYVVTLAVSWSADHFNARGLHSAAFSFIGAMGFLASAVLPVDAYLHRYGCLIVASSGAFSCISPLLGWLSSNIDSTGAAGLAIALNISFGAPGQIVGVWI
ncbi:hypothetical protein PENANT_c003G09257 [Penicillium antarcticum]|uniref:Major facilitator superfamily (MFS) profile domain-containing protein n=1 Tax=Penicillium antarcticum TaxID=416450 RepID=A0A1V6QIJ8_9EURO|nr:hypothetical protein PENANT_c003G09257 [Penicillium antarcticum]